MRIAVVASGDTTTSPPSGWTERNDSNQATPTTAIETATRDTGFTGTTITFGATQSTTYASFAVEIDGSAGAARTGTLDKVLGSLTIDPGLGLSIGQGQIRQRLYSTNPATGTLTAWSSNITVTAVANATDTFTCASTSDMLTADGPHYLSGSSLPGGTDAVTPYYVIVASGTTFKLASSAINAVAGTAVNLTTDGSGTITLVRKVTTRTSGSAFITGVARGVWSTDGTAARCSIRSLSSTSANSLS